MYHTVVKILVKKSFKSLSAGDFQPALNLMSVHCNYHFVGTHALGGVRSNRALIKLWFERFLRILPGFEFKPTDVLVNGWPWQTKVAVKLDVSWQKPDGTFYRNVGLQLVKLKWFKAVDIITVDDTQGFGNLLTELVEKYGVTEAGAIAIEG